MEYYHQFSYRNALEILEKKYPYILPEIFDILFDKKNSIDLSNTESQRKLSSQVQGWFVQKGWKKEQPCFSKPLRNLKYDLSKDNIVMEIELGHQRLIYADLFKFMADYSNTFIDLGIFIVAGEPDRFGHKWHNTLESTRRKILAVQEVFLVPIFILAVNP